MSNGKNHVCPLAIAGSLDNRLRRWIQNPQKILRPYINEGMTVLDIGCGPGFFSIEIAQMVGKAGRVIASDLQEGMLRKIKDKIHGTELEGRITLHHCPKDRIGISEQVDFVLAFYMIHELPDQKNFFDEIGHILRPAGQILIAEPPFHVSGKAFEITVEKCRSAGFTLLEKPKIFLSKAAILRKD